MSNDKINLSEILENLSSKLTKGPMAMSIPVPEIEEDIESMSRRQFHIEHYYVIESTDEDWVEDLAGQAIVYGFEPPEDISPFSAYLYIDEAYSYTLNPLISKPSFNKWPDPPEGEHLIVPVRDFMSEYENEIDPTPACKFLVPSQHNRDPALILYDYPFTLMPLEAQCINPALGASPHSPKACEFASHAEYSTCQAYGESEPFLVGTVSEVPVTVDRTVSKNVYTAGEHTFNTLKELQAWAKENNSELDVTWVPHPGENDFYPPALARLELTYAG